MVGGITRSLFAGDPAALAAGRLGRAARGAAPAMPRARRSLSAWTWTWAAEPEGVPLSHHTVFFSPDYPAEFEDLDRRRRPPADPTLYICAQDRPAREDAAAPEGPERLLMILNAPADGDRGPPTPEEIERCTTTSFERLAASGLRVSPPDLSATPEALTTPDRFEAMFPATGGALYGANPHGALATFRRPTARSPLPGLYLAGGGCHPGPGAPMATRSGRLAAAAIMADRAST
jgi:1-hydroxycarotenoid 3,4-desaturase